MKRLTFLMPLMAISLLFACNLPAQQNGQLHDTYKASINRVLREDSAAWPASGGNYTYVVAAMRRIDLSRCPRDFAADYVKHIHAWEGAAEIWKALKNLRSNENVGRVVVAGAIQKLLGMSDNDNALKNAADLEQRLNAAKEAANKEIQRTYDIVELVAIQYDATLIKK